ncbi:MAG: S41 family peptidase [Chitinophagaceae bacterium]
MRKIFIYCLGALILGLASCDTNKKQDRYRTKLTVADMQDDLQVLGQLLQTVHAGTYVYNTVTDIRNLLDSVQKSIHTPLTQREFYAKVDYIIDRLRCVHTDLRFDDAVYDSLANQKEFFPIPLFKYGNKLYVNSDQYTNTKLGAELLSINGVPVATILSKILVHRHVDGFGTEGKDFGVNEDFGINYFLEYGGQFKFKLRLKDPQSHEIVDLTLQPETFNKILSHKYEDTYYFFPSDAPYDFEMIKSSKTALLTIRSFSFETYASRQAYRNFVSNSFLLLKLNHIRQLIIDCRSNSGGYYMDTYFLLSYLLNESRPEFDSAVKRFDTLPLEKYSDPEDSASIIYEDTTTQYYTKINSRDFQLKAEHIDQWEPAPNRFEGKLFLITDGNVISAGAIFAGVLKTRRHAYIVGAETAGGAAVHNSGAISYILPHSGLKINIPTKRYYTLYNQQPLGRGVLPDKKIVTTPKDIMGNEDPALGYILDSLIH